MKDKIFLFQRVEGLHVMSRRLLQMTNKLSIWGGEFKYKEKKSLGCF
jgi:hypothetical protein